MITRAIFGGWSPSNEIYGNKIYFNGGTFYDWEGSDGIDGINGTIFGGYSTSGAVHDNEIIIGEGVNTSLIEIKGGKSTSGDVYNNTITVNSNNINVGITSGESDSGKIYNNKVNIYGGTIRYVGSASDGGGDVGTGEWYNNTINIYGGTIGLVSSGVSPVGLSHDNTINIRGGTINGNILGGNYNGIINFYDGTLNGDENGVSITGSNGGMYGNDAYVSLDAHDGKVNIYGGKLAGSIFGGSAKGNAYNNTVNISNAIYNVDDSGIFGGLTYGSSAGSSAYNNVVNIYSGNFSAISHPSLIIGGASYDNSVVYDNKVNIEDGTFSGNIIAGSGNSNSEVYDNVLNIKGGTFTSGYLAAGSGTNVHDNAINIYGSPDLSGVNLQGKYASNGTGNSLNIYTKNLTAQNIYNFNSVNFYLDENILNGDTILTLADGEGNNTDLSNTDITAVIQGGSPLTADDTVTLLKNSNGITEAKSATGTLHEGISVTHDIDIYLDEESTSLIAALSVKSSEDEGGEDTETTITDSSNNVVNVYDSDSGTIYGGNTDTGNAQNNTVNLYGGTNLENIYGGFAPNGETSGNVLNVRNKNISAQNLYNFDTMNFYISNDVENGDTLLTLADMKGTDLSGVSINAGVVSGNSNLVVGDTINLLTNSNGLTTNSATSYGTLTEGVSLNYGMSIGHAGNSIVANITKSPNSLNSETEILPKSVDKTTVSTVTTSLDTPTIESVIENPVETTETSEDSGTFSEVANVPIVEPKGWEIFANMGGGSLKTKGSDGSHVDMTTQSINLGFARSLESSAGKFTIAPIFDYASGKYDSYLETGIHGSGKTRYIAGGLIARRMLPNGFYYGATCSVMKSYCA